MYISTSAWLGWKKAIAKHEAKRMRLGGYYTSHLDCAGWAIESGGLYSAEQYGWEKRDVPAYHA